MTQYERNAIILSAVVCLSGLAVSVFLGAGHYFSRSGSLVVIVAIFFASLELRARISAAPNFVERKLEANRSTILQQGKDRGLDDARSNKLFEQVSSEIHKEVADAIDETKRRLLRVELILFIAGTAIWGFGDLPVDALIYHFCVSS
ncbi:MAG: hypothetical protein LC637_01075 [Xanthomonadaceae bacterium]|nr:hypothetical protein [Xanthomonadaceae bacterium]